LNFSSPPIFRNTTPNSSGTQWPQSTVCPCPFSLVLVDVLANWQLSEYKLLCLGIFSKLKLPCLGRLEGPEMNSSFSTPNFSQPMTDRWYTNTSTFLFCG
jgi:hypothetical protein